MTTSLAAQLAQIRAHGTNPLDLKAQKKAHSKSLLFDVSHAATQDYDTLFQICYEAYQELCRLDPRFVDFAGNLFSDQSKQEDRTQMTAAQNKQLDGVLEDFMGLLGSRVLLKPALKAMEWLIRRFSVHENNMICFVLTFLPYHTSPTFLTVLSVLPERRPAAFKFLQPYVQSSTNPPRHTIVYTAAHNQAFFNAFNTYTLSISRRKQQYPALLSFWSSVTSEAVALMLDRSRSGRLELQKQNQEDVVLRILPLLADGLSIPHSADLQVGCYMILTVLSSKTKLGESVLTAIMDLVVSNWKSVAHAGLICLIVLAQQKQEIELSKKTFKALVAIDQLSDHLVVLKSNYKVEKLVLGLIIGLLDRLGDGSTERLRTVRVLLEANLLSSDFVAAALSPMLRLTRGIDSLPPTNDAFNTQSTLIDLFRCLAHSEVVGPTVRLALENMDPKTRQYSFELLRTHRILKDEPGMQEENVGMQDTDGQSGTTLFEELVSRIPAQTAFEVSLLSHTESYILPSLSDAFVAACRSPKHLDAFSEISVLRKSLAMAEPLYFSFFVRIWCGTYPIPARVAAIRQLSNYFRAEKLVADVQMLFPYILHAFADPSSQVRRAATELVLVLAQSYNAVDNQSNDQPRLPILGKDQINGQDKKHEEIAWLPWEVAVKFIQDWLLRHVEEFRLESRQISRCLADCLGASAELRDVGNRVQKFKTSVRLSVLTWLCSHVVSTPLYSVKNRLLPTLTSVPKVGQTSTVALLNPLLTATLAQGQEMITTRCAREHVNVLQFIDHVLEIAMPKDREGIKLLQDFISDRHTTTSPLLLVAVFRRLRNVWPLLKSQIQVSLGRIMLDLAASEPSSDDAKTKQKEALDMLRTVKLSTEVLQSLLEDCPSLAQTVLQKPAKRRRTVSPSRVLGIDIRRTNIVLEAIESSATEADAPLLGRLFEVLADLQGYKGCAGTALHYLELLAMNSILSILQSSATVQIQESDVRADLLVDCIRNSSNPQVQQSALLLVSVLAGIAPELILHNVMPIFMFMNSNIVNRTDDYSAHVVKQTMESVIPRVMDSLRKRHKEPLAGVSELLFSFAAAFEHVPSQRRLALYQSMMDLVGVDDYLFALVILLHRKLPNNKSVLQFSTDLLDCYQVETQFQTVERYMTTILDSLEPKPTFSTHLMTRSPLENPMKHTTNMLSHLIMLFGDKRLISKSSRAFTLESSHVDGLRTILSHVMDHVLSISRKFPEQQEGDLPMVDYISTLQSLLENADVQAFCDALKSFEHRLSIRKSEAVAGHNACLGFLPSLATVTQSSVDEVTKRIALTCIDRIVEHFGKKDLAAVIRATNTVISASCLGAASEEMQVTSLLCLSTIVEVLGDEFIPFLPQTLPKTLSLLNNVLEADECSKRLHNAAYSFSSALLLNTPWAIGGPDLDHLLKVSHESADTSLDGDCFAERHATLDLLAKQINPRDCCAALERTWASAMACGPEALKEQLKVFEALIGRLSKSDVCRHSEAFAGLLAMAFDLRRIQFCPRTEESYEDSEVEEVEDVSNNVAMSMIYKVNDKIFRPIFAQLVEWASSPSAKAKIQRQTTLYNFLMHFFDGLKSIVTNYAALIIDECTDILKSAVLTDETSKLLWTKVIQTLQKTFAHDQDGFWQSPTHFRSISEVLLNQIKPAADASLTSNVIPAITELAVASDSPNNHKTINAAILKYTRSDVSAVRLAAVQCQQSLTNRLGEEWLALLPEMLPFISELQEDDDENVERETLRWIKRIEDVLGESLTPMLQ
ncbi:MAG: hypothetical protein Q9181_001390 [Wetmoreana brouardii]